MAGAGRISCVALPVAALICTGAACRRHESGAWGGSRGVRCTAEAVVPPSTGDSVVLRIKAVNHTREVKTVGIDHCDQFVGLAIVTAPNDSRRTWTRSVWQQTQDTGNVVFACAAYQFLVRLSGGDSTETFRTVVAVRDIRGDSLPAGRYRAFIGADAKLKGGLVTSDFVLP